MLWIAGCAHAFELKVHQTILGATFGASAVLLYGVMESKLAQPRNVIGNLLHVFPDDSPLLSTSLGI